MRHVVLAVVLGAIGCVGEPGDAFVGDWRGTYWCEGEWHDGRTYVQGRDWQTVHIYRDLNGDLYQAGQCIIPLRVISDAELEMEYADCLTELSDGTPVTYAQHGGNLQLVDGSLQYASEAMLTFEDGSGFSFTAYCGMLDGRRETP